MRDTGLQYVMPCGGLSYVHFSLSSLPVRDYLCGDPFLATVKPFTISAPSPTTYTTRNTDTVNTEAVGGHPR